MNRLQFAQLMWSIYGSKKLPDLDWIQDLGLLAVKLGQMHALRIDFLDPAKCLHLSQLYRKNAAVPKENFQALLQRGAVWVLRAPSTTWKISPWLPPALGRFTGVDFGMAVK